MRIKIAMFCNNYNVLNSSFVEIQGISILTSNCRSFGNCANVSILYISCELNFYDFNFLEAYGL